MQTHIPKLATITGILSYWWSNVVDKSKAMTVFKAAAKLRARHRAAAEKEKRIGVKIQIKQTSMGEKQSKSIKHQSNNHL